MNYGNKRTESYGQLSEFTIVDRLGIFLSERIVRKYIRKIDGHAIRLLDLGCGFHARILKCLAAHIAYGIGVDVAVCGSVKAIPNIKIIERPIEDALRELESDSFDIILAISVLEHMEDPLFVLKECRRVLKNEGYLLINVPTWFGKNFLELSAFKLKLSIPLEMDDHKMYYGKRDLWPLLVKAGFKPSSIKLCYYKFGFNLFSICRKR